MVRLASAQRLSRRSTLDELTDLSPDGRQHGDEVRLAVPDFARKQLDDADRQSAADDRKGDGGAQSGTEFGARLLVVVRRQVVDLRSDARLPDPADQAATDLDG